MAFEGYIDRASKTELSGWIFDNCAPLEPLNLEILDGEHVVARLSAADFRADLQSAGKGNGKHGFNFKSPTPAASSFSARVAGKRWLIPPTGGFRKSSPLPMRFEETLAHSLEYGLPGAALQDGFSPQPVTATDDAEIAGRLMQAYAKTVADNPDAKNRRDDQWASLEDAHHQEILSLLRKEDARGLMRYLGDAHGRGITHGITQGEHTTNTLKANPDARRLVMLAVLDHLTSLAEYLGIQDVECPDQHGQWGENIHAEPTAVIDRISAEIGIPVLLPQVVGSAFGLRTKTGILSTRDVLALYAALRIKMVLMGAGKQLSTSSVCEIGGGLGGVAYYANRLGTGNYTIIDLPLVSMLQGYFLIRSLPGVKVALYGEDIPDAAVRLLPTYAFASQTGTYDLLFNQDSMPEMHRAYSTGYIREAGVKKVPQFLSINQEARARQNDNETQTAVRELVREAGGYTGQYRFRHWVRAGYVEELYSLLG